MLPCRQLKSIYFRLKPATRTPLKTTHHRQTTFTKLLLFAGLSTACVSFCHPAAFADDDADKTAAKANRHNYIPGFDRKRDDDTKDDIRKKDLKRGTGAIIPVDDPSDGRRPDADSDSSLNSSSSSAPNAASDPGSDPKMKNNGDMDIKHDNNFDGSQFDTPSFQDSNFGRHSFIDLLLNSRPKIKNDVESDKNSPEDYKRKHDSDPGISIHEEALRDKERHKDRAYDELMELLASPEIGPNQWVPDKLDPLNQGGFTTAPDNGSPVPYRLNGHVDLERAAPWKDADK